MSLIFHHFMEQAEALVEEIGHEHEDSGLPNAALTVLLGIFVEDMRQQLTDEDGAMLPWDDTTQLPGLSPKATRRAIGLLTEYLTGRYNVSPQVAWTGGVLALAMANE